MLPRGGCASRGDASRGCASKRVSFMGGVLSGGVLPGGRVYLPGGYLPGECTCLGVYLSRGCVPALGVYQPRLKHLCMEIYAW